MSNEEDNKISEAFRRIARKILRVPDSKCPRCGRDFKNPMARICVYCEDFLDRQRKARNAPRKRRKKKKK